MSEHNFDISFLETLEPDDAAHAVCAMPVAPGYAVTVNYVPHDWQQNGLDINRREHHLVCTQCGLRRVLDEAWVSTYLPAEAGFEPGEQ